MPWAEMPKPTVTLPERAPDQAARRNDAGYDAAAADALRRCPADCDAEARAVTQETNMSKQPEPQDVNFKDEPHTRLEHGTYPDGQLYPLNDSTGQDEREATVTQPEETK